jgi:hypothetical protein
LPGCDESCAIAAAAQVDTNNKTFVSRIQLRCTFALLVVSSKAALVS